MAKKLKTENSVEDDLNAELSEDLNIFDIDENNLVVECQKQPKLMWRWTRKLALAKAEVDRAEAAVKLEEAELDAAIRESPDSYGLEKVTEPAIKKAIAAQDSLIKKQKRYRRLKLESDVIAGAVSSLSHRKSSIENIVELHGQAYFAAPTLRGASKEKIENADKRSTMKSIGLRRKRRRDEED